MTARRTGARPSAATLHDVARAAGVSQATASRVLNGSVRNVTSDNVNRVLAAAQQLDYQPHLSAQAVARGSTRTAALVVNGLEDPYYSTIAGGVIEGAEAAGLIVTMAVADRSPERELQIVRTLRGLRPRAVVLTGSRTDDEGGVRAALVDELGAYRAAGGSVVVISQPDLPFPTIGIDHHGGARELARAVVGLGYRSFALLGADPRLKTQGERAAGFRAGLRECGLELPHRYAVTTDFDRSGGYTAARHLIERGLIERGLVGPGPGGPPLVFAVNDVMAIGAMAAFRDAGLVPGRDVAVAGFDDVGFAVDVVPALTTVAVPLHDVGLDAIRLALSGPDATPPAPIPTRVMLRESTPPV